MKYFEEFVFEVVGKLKYQIRSESVVSCNQNHSLPVLPHMGGTEQDKDFINHILSKHRDPLDRFK